jgi:hypothetical protein
VVSSACNTPLKLPKLLEDVRLKWEIADGPRTPDIFRQPPDPTEFEQLNEALSRGVCPVEAKLSAHCWAAAIVKWLRKLPEDHQVLRCSTYDTRCNPTSCSGFVWRRTIRSVVGHFQSSATNKWTGTRTEVTIIIDVFFMSPLSD